MKLIFNFGGSKFTYVRLEIPIPTKRLYDKFLAAPVELAAIRKMREREAKILAELGAHSSAEIRKRERVLKELRRLQGELDKLQKTE